jgi:SAM-dependent methyltransferase
VWRCPSSLCSHPPAEPVSEIPDEPSAGGAASGEGWSGEGWSGEGWSGERYQQRFDQLAATGQYVHGEADFVAALGPTSVLDAGCGTGRVARELARRGIEVAGVDNDASMIATARQLAPDLEWHLGDVAVLDLGPTFDVVMMAGNVPLFTPASNRGQLVAGCARHLSPDGSLVTGFQLDRGYAVEEYDEHCRRVGLGCMERWATWSRDPFRGGDYAVSVHRFIDTEHPVET